METGVSNNVVDISLEAIVDEMFMGSRTTATLQNGTIVTFHQAKFKQIAVVTRLFQEMLNRIPKEKFSELLGMIVDAQTLAMSEGKSNTDMTVNAGILIENAIGEKSMLLTIFSTVLDMLPDFIPQFCDLSADAFNELDIDEAVLVATGVVAVNYSFFTQKLPPLLKSVTASWSKKSSIASSTRSNSPSTTSSGG